MIYIVWHRDEITLLPRCGFTKGNVMVSQSRDGDILAAVISRWGYKVSRGSSSKGAAAALKSLVSALRRGDSIILAADGPRGPRQKAKPGALWLSARLGVPVCPVAAAVSRSYVFRKSWSHSRVPLPFARVCGVFGETRQFGPEALGWDKERQSGELEELLRRSGEEALEKLKNWSGSCI
jgi:lysophospholipid acyltransferase (LPLAT)-like uncharacterized protein